MPIYTRAKSVTMPQKPGLQGIYEQIEAAARTCYRSEGKTQYDEQGNSTTAEEFANKIVNVYKHQSVAEHAAVYLVIRSASERIPPEVQKYFDNKYSRVHSVSGGVNIYYYISTNYRVLVENGWLGDLKHMTEPTDFHIRRRTIRLFTDRGVSAELNRHRVNSPSERSTRYVNYGHDGAITVVVPEEIDDKEIVTSINEMGGVEWAFKNYCLMIAEEQEELFDVVDTWLFANLATEWSYLRLLKLGWKPQQARRVLPMDIQTELVVSAYEDDWARFFAIRFYGVSGTPHPDMKLLASDMMDQFLATGWNEPVILAEKIAQNGLGA